MKYRILAVFIILMLLLTITVSALDYEYTISLDSGFTTAQSGDDLTEISQKLNMTTDDVNAYFNKNGLLYLAVSDDTKTQIRISAFSDNFSSAVNDISQLNDDALHEFMSAMGEDGENTCEIVVNNGRKYIKTKDTLKDSGGVYTVTQYITICSNKTFYFAGYNDGEDTSEAVKTAFESFLINEVLPTSPNFTLYSTLIIGGIIVFSVIAIIMVLGIIKPKTKEAVADEC